MPLPIRDGNQSLTTLSTLIVNSAHVPAHTVVSLGSQAITDIAQAVSGVELGQNTLNALENITVTMGQVTVTGGLTNAELRASSVTVGGSVQVSNFPATQTVTFTQASVTFTQASVTFGATTGSVSVLNFPATQTVTFSQASVTFTQASVTFTQASVTFSSITGSVSVLNLPATQTVTFTQASVTFGTPVVTGSVSILNFPSTQTIAGTVTANDSGALTIVNSSTVTKADVKFTALAGAYNQTDVAQSYTLSPINVDMKGISYVDGQYVNYRDTCVAQLQGQGGPAWKAQLIASSVTVSNSVTIGSLPAISGTVTANLSNTVTATWKGAIGSSNAVPIVFAQEGQAGGSAISYDGSNTSLNVNVKGSLPAISGTVTANVTNSVTVGAIIGPAGGSCLQGISGAGDAVRIVLQGRDSAGNYSPIVGSGLNQYNIPIYGTVTVGNSVTIGSLPAISGTVTANTAYEKYANIYQSPPSNAVQLGFADSGNFFVNVRHNNGLPVRQQEGSSVTIGSLPAISGTVTANVLNTTVTVSSFPRPTWTDYSSSVVTANSAVTAISTITRSYLLAQVTTGQMFLNIGANCTTGNGVYFSAGQGFAWETAVPQGIVSIISSVTGTNYVLKDG